jgi:hypothetical protein
MTTSNSSKNALSHGAYSSQAVLPWENEQEFKDLHEDLREEFFPTAVLRKRRCSIWLACSGRNAD